MEWADIWKIVLCAVGSAGGIGTIIVLVIKFSANTIAERLSKKYEAKLQKELEKYNIKTRVGCACDGGMPDNPRYALYQSQYTALIANRAGEPKNYTATVAGRCCESGQRDVRPASRACAAHVPDRAHRPARASRDAHDPTYGQYVWRSRGRRRARNPRRRLCPGSHDVPRRARRRHPDRCFLYPHRRLYFHGGF